MMYTVFLEKRKEVLSKPIEQSPYLEANISSVIQEILTLIWELWFPSTFIRAHHWTFSKARLILSRNIIFVLMYQPTK
jgi:hypothetical protein